MEQNPCCIAVGLVAEAGFLPIFLSCKRPGPGAIHRLSCLHGAELGAYAV